MNTNPKFDEYIAKAQPFAQPILLYLRKVVHTACNSATEEMKWSFPNFSYKSKIMCSMAAFKQHCSFGFWLEEKMKTMELYRSKNPNEKGGMGSFGKIKDIKTFHLKKSSLNV